MKKKNKQFYVTEYTIGYFIEVNVYLEKKVEKNSNHVSYFSLVILALLFHFTFNHSLYFLIISVLTQLSFICISKKSRTFANARYTKRIIC